MDPENFYYNDQDDWDERYEPVADDRRIDSDLNFYYEDQYSLEDY